MAYRWYIDDDGSFLTWIRWEWEEKRYSTESWGTPVLRKRGDNPQKDRETGARYSRIT